MYDCDKFQVKHGMDVEFTLAWRQVNPHFGPYSKKITIQKDQYDAFKNAPLLDPRVDNKGQETGVDNSLYSFP